MARLRLKQCCIFLFCVICIYVLWSTENLFPSMTLFMQHHAVLRTPQKFMFYETTHSNEVPTHKGTIHPSKEVRSTQDTMLNSDQRGQTVERRGIVLKNVSLLPITHRPLINRTEHLQLMHLLQTVSKQCLLHNLTFFLFGGTLLGSYRHHGIIPWDDDVDIIMNASQKNIARKVFSSLGDKYAFYVPFGPKQSKFYRTDSPVIPRMRFRWPYIDTFFFQENETHIWDANPQFSDLYVYHKSLIFPLRSGPFGDEYFPVPYDTQSVLERTYDVLSCKATTYSHKREDNIRWNMEETYPCSHFYNHYPFVFRNQRMSKDSTCFQRESLELGGKEIRAVWVESGCR